MKFVAVFLIVVVLVVLKRQACKTGGGSVQEKGKTKSSVADSTNDEETTGKVVAPADAQKKTCGKSLPGHANDVAGNDESTYKKIIEQVTPWTMLVVIPEASEFRYCVGVRLQETVVATSPRCNRIRSQHSKQGGPIKVFAAKDVTKHGVQTDGLGVRSMAPLRDSTTEKQFGGLLRLTKAPDDPDVTTICPPKNEIGPGSRCLIVGWYIVKNEDDGVTFDASVFAPTIISPEECQERWGDASADGICVESTEMRARVMEFAYGPLVCTENRIWSLYGLTKMDYDKEKPFLFTSFFKHQENDDVTNALNILK